jgi:spermidine synthase
MAGNRHWRPCGVHSDPVALATGLFIHLQRSFGLSYEAFSLVRFLLTFALLLVPITFMGGTLPILSHALFRLGNDLGRTAGMLYAMNTAGAVFGVILAGYLALPAFGNRMTLAIAAIANVLVGLVVIAYTGQSQHRKVRGCSPCIG